MGTSVAGIYMRKLEIMAADPPCIISEITQREITLYEVKFLDAFKVELKVRDRNVADIIHVVERHGGTCKTVQQSCTSRILRLLPKRIVLLVGVIGLLMLTVFIPSRVLFVNVTGNSAVPTNLILSKAEECGVSFGAVRKTIRNEKIKNHLLSSIPQLLWAGVNTRGCVAEITVQEKSEISEVYETDNSVSNIVASRDGIVVSSTILQGTGVCSVGQAVLEGELLVSGYTDCGIIIQATDAQAEILAQTQRNITVVSPVVYEHRDVLIEKKKCYSLLVGKKLIKLYKDSGISDTSCAKIYERYYMRLPGGFFLPVAIISEQIDHHQMQTERLQDFGWLEEFSDAYLGLQMVAGQIIAEDESVSRNDVLACLNGQYECIEMIGKKVLEENIDTYGVSS